jgi:hypothetical protein
MLFNWKKRRRTNSSIVFVVTFSFFILQSSFLTPLRACQLCFPFPIKSAADHLLENEWVVFARLDSENKFSYVITRELKGYTETKKLDCFADSATRRRLEAYPDNVVIFVRGKDADGWRSLGIADRRYQQVVERIVAHEHIWSGKQGEQKRIEFFMQLFDNEHQAIFELAYLELGNAPYSTIRKVGQVISKERIRSILTRREYIEWRPLAILLLAQSQDERDHQLIEKSFRSCQKFGLSTNLAAWVAAYIEIHGEDAVKEIEATWLNDSNRPETEVRAVLKALSVHGRNGQVHLRDRIVSCYRVALRVHPTVAGPVASDLLQWKRWKFRKQLAHVIKQKIKLPAGDAKLIQQYLVNAENGIAR